MKKKKTRGGKGEGNSLALQFNSLPTDRRALLSERLEQAKFVVGSLPCSERFFLRVVRFSPLLKN